MAISFPVSPNLNDEYVYGSRSWIWNGEAWDLQAGTVGPTGGTGPTGSTGATGPTGSSIGIVDTQPVSPISGDLWFESDTGIMWLYYDSVWVEF